MILLYPNLLSSICEWISHHVPCILMKLSLRQLVVKRSLSFRFSGMVFVNPIGVGWFYTGKNEIHILNTNSPSSFLVQNNTNHDVDHTWITIWNKSISTKKRICWFFVSLMIWVWIYFEFLWEYIFLVSFIVWNSNSTV